MQYRKFGKDGWEVSALGFGAMRLPTKGDGKIDRPEAIAMMRYAIDNGVNYVDTAWPYHDGESELVVAEALKDGYRDKVRLATKLPSWTLEKRSDMDDRLNKQLEKLQTDYIDYYLLHALNDKHWDIYKKLDVFTWIPEKIKEGKIKFIGFSFHDDYDLFKEIIDAYDWDFTQIQYNYVDTEFQAGTKGLRLAHSKGIANIVMEPIRGGQLGWEPPEKVKKIWDKAEKKRTPADWALQWCWNQPEVGTVLSGMSNMQQVKENVESANNSGVGILNSHDLELIEQVSKEIQGPVGCTGCNYCMPCPYDVNIPQSFQFYNIANVYGNYEEKKADYMKFIPEKSRASACQECGTCEEHCPQNLEIINDLKDVAAYFEK